MFRGCWCAGLRAVGFAVELRISESTLLSAISNALQFDD